MGEIGTSSGGGDEQDPQTSDLKQKGKLIEKATSSGGEEGHETIQQRRSNAPDAQVPPHAIIPIAGMETSNTRGEQHRVMQKVLPLLLKEEKNKEDYIPKAVSIGPYHHGQEELHLAEAFKPKAVQMFVYGGERIRDFYYSNVFARIGEIRSCYEEGSTDKYSDRKLAKMMLYDACFIIVRIEANMPMDRIGWRMNMKYGTMVENLGRLNMALSHRDLLLLENQIPYWIVKLFITLRYGEEAGQKLLNRFLNGTSVGEYDLRSRLEGGKEPFHLLEALRLVAVSNWNESEHQNGLCLKCRQRCWEQCRQGFKSRWLCCFRVDQRPLASAENGLNRSTGLDLEAGVDPAAVADPDAMTGVKCRCLDCMGVCREGPEVVRRGEVERIPHSFRSVMDLKKKGIRFKPSSSRSFSDVKFESGLFFSQLRLPKKFVSIHTKIFFLNMVAYELSPQNRTNYVVISYIDLMKSLIESKEDVAELRKRKILYNALGSDEQVLEVFRDINTYANVDRPIFRDIKDKIEAHYSSRMKKWIGEVRDVHFRNPRTAIAWLAAVSLIAIASASLYYSARRGSNK
ncbi:UNVERIFIED_CONTAM: hypothetical protein Scaly_0838300 [Sesamum calycinum]|uniref:Uncharacterized protein n=1 Tax=Sesamum calycinum TaxID=2727403 RepID=A0AAW2RAL6_9LAMI